MKYGRTYNFSAGPATMPEEVLEEVRDEMMNYRGSGMCVMEMSHRSKVYQQIIDEAEADLRELMGIPDNYKVLFIQGGATLQFSMIPMNLMKNGKAVYKVTDYGIIYGGVQKNIGPAGLAIVIIREDLIRDDLTNLPIYLQYKTHADAGSMYNTPNCWAIYVCGKVFKYLKKLGGLSAMEAINVDKAKVFYDFLDQSKMFYGTVVPQDRSLMNIPFVTGDKELDAEVIAYTKAAGFENLKGHKSVGGLRASIYNAMPKEGVEALVECLKKFEAEHTK